MSEYYDWSTNSKDVTNGEKADAEDVNKINLAVDAGFALVSTNIGSSVTWANKAHQWAEEAYSVEVEVGEYSAHHWADKAAAEAVERMEFVTDQGSVGTGTVTISYGASAVHTLTVTGAITIDFSGMTTGYNNNILLVLTNGGTNITWSSAIKWAGGNEPVLSTTGRDRLIFSSEDGGVTIDGALAGGGFA